MSVPPGPARNVKESIMDVTEYTYYEWDEAVDSDGNVYDVEYAEIVDVDADGNVVDDEWEVVATVY
jgi:hypothetical protein